MNARTFEAHRQYCELFQRYLAVLDREFTALRFQNTAVLNSCRIIQGELEEKLTKWQDNNFFDAEEGLSGYNSGAEVNDKIREMKQSALKKIDRNRAEAERIKEQTKQEIAALGKSRRQKGKNFPKFSHLNAPVIVDLRR